MTLQHRLLGSTRQDKGVIQRGRVDTKISLPHLQSGAKCKTMAKNEWAPCQAKNSSPWPTWSLSSAAAPEAPGTTTQMCNCDSLQTLYLHQTTNWTKKRHHYRFPTRCNPAICSTGTSLPRRTPPRQSKKAKIYYPWTASKNPISKQISSMIPWSRSRIARTSFNTKTTIILESQTRNLLRACKEKLRRTRAPTGPPPAQLPVKVTPAPRTLPLPTPMSKFLTWSPNFHSQPKVASRLTTRTNRIRMRIWRIRTCFSCAIAISSACAMVMDIMDTMWVACLSTDCPSILRAIWELLCRGKLDILNLKLWAWSWLKLSNQQIKKCTRWYKMCVSQVRLVCRWWPTAVNFL